DGRPAPDRHGGDAHRARSDGGAVADGHAHGLPVVRGLGGAVRVDGTGEVVVGEHHAGAHEDAVLEHGGLVDQGVVLDLAAVSHDDAGADVGAATDDAVATDAGVLSHLGQVPDRGPVSND